MDLITANKQAAAAVLLLAMRVIMAMAIAKMAFSFDLIDTSVFFEREYQSP